MKPTKYRTLRNFTLTGLIGVACVRWSQGALLINFEGASGSEIVNYSLSGSTTATRTVSTVAGEALYWNELSGNAFLEALNGEFGTFQNGSPSIINVTTVSTSALDSVYLDHDGVAFSEGNDDTGLLLGQEFRYTTGDVISL